MALFGLYGCQKEQISALSESQIEEVNVTPRVQAFVQNATHHASSREDGLITADSAEWYIEAALNYAYTDIAKQYEAQLTDTVTISIPLVDGSVQEVQVGEAYNTLGQLINSSNVQGSSHVAIVDVVSTNTGSSLDLTAVYVVGSGYERGVPNTTYGSNDYWYWGLQPQNLCHCTGGALNGACADKQIQARINFAINGGYYQYWTNVESWVVVEGFDDVPSKNVGVLDHISPISSDNTTLWDGIRDYPVFYQNNGSGCLDPTDMRFYTQGTWDLMQTVRSSYVPTKMAASCTVTGDLLTSTSLDLKYHNVTYRYGKLAKSH